MTTPNPTIRWHRTPVSNLNGQTVSYMWSTCLDYLPNGRSFTMHVKESDSATWMARVNLQGDEVLVTEHMTPDDAKLCLEQFVSMVLVPTNVA